MKVCANTERSLQGETWNDDFSLVNNKSPDTGLFTADVKIASVGEDVCFSCMYSLALAQGYGFAEHHVLLAFSKHTLYVYSSNWYHHTKIRYMYCNGPEHCN